MTRSVEGLHSLVTRLLKRSPAGKLPFISFELRSKQLVELALFKPAETQQQCSFCTATAELSGHETFLRTVAPAIDSPTFSGPPCYRGRGSRHRACGRLPSTCVAWASNCSRCRDTTCCGKLTKAPAAAETQPLSQWLVLATAGKPALQRSYRPETCFA